MHSTYAFSMQTLYINLWHKFYAAYNKLDPLKKKTIRLKVVESLFLQVRPLGHTVPYTLILLVKNWKLLSMFVEQVNFKT